jgi:hypothetical protein
LKSAIKAIPNKDRFFCVRHLKNYFLQLQFGIIDTIIKIHLKTLIDGLEITATLVSNFLPNQ